MKEYQGNQKISTRSDSPTDSDETPFLTKSRTHPHQLFSPPQEKKIISIDLSGACMLSNACEHDIILNYNDDSHVDLGILSAHEIRAYAKYFTPDQKKHFAPAHRPLATTSDPDFQDIPIDEPFISEKKGCCNIL